MKALSQYHVSPTAIISKPRALLEWCHRYRITYTFSPNFLLAQICREVAAAPYTEDELDLSTIQAFISGGEAVPVRTAIDFSDIVERHGAPRNALRPGFGMTETGVSSWIGTLGTHLLILFNVGRMYLRCPSRRP